MDTPEIIATGSVVLFEAANAHLESGTVLDVYNPDDSGLDIYIVATGDGIHELYLDEILVEHTSSA